jgi:carboxyl-terminal processing protease
MAEQPVSQFQIRLPLILAATLAAGMFIGQQLPRYGRHVQPTGNFTVGGGNSAIDEVLSFIDARYVDTVDIGRLKGNMIEQALLQLDPHSIYISPDELQASTEDMNGGFEGVGIEFIMVDDTIQVVTPLNGGPSEAAGIMAGDKLITINDSMVAGVKIANGSIYKQLRGPKGSVVKLGILRGREINLRYFDIVRDRIAVNSVEIAYMIDEQTGYIKVNRFTANTYNEFMEALRPLAEERGLQHLILDLRGNPGGYLEEATQMLSQVFPEGKLLVYTEGRSEQRREYKSNGRARFNIQEVAVLIDEGSASASEIMAGAIQDHDRGWIVGRRTFGKGLVQEEYPLSDGGALRLTVARYYTPSGRCIQRAYKGQKDYAHEDLRRLKSGELTNGQFKLADSTQFYTGMGRLVYAGGGITPDVFVPFDTSFISPYFNVLNQQMPQFVARWLENPAHTAAIPTDLNAFLALNIPDTWINDLAAFVEKNGTQRNEKALQKAQSELKMRLKARLARIKFSEEAQYHVINTHDPVVEKAWQLIRDRKALK